MTYPLLDTVCFIAGRRQTEKRGIVACCRATFTGVLLTKEIAISMDGRGRALDNIFVERLWRSIKHEDVYLKGYATMSELLIGLTEYFVYYNTERPN